MEMESEELKVYKIPSNYSSGVPFFGSVFPVANVVESTVLCLVLCFISCAIFSSSAFSVKLSAILCSGILSFTIGLGGIAGLSISRAATVLIKFIKTKNIYTRVKTEDSASKPQQVKKEKAKQVSATETEPQSGNLKIPMRKK